MAILTNVVLPTTVGGYLEFDLTAGAFLPGGAPNWTVAVCLDVAGDKDRVVIWQDGAFQGQWAQESSTTGVGTVASPMHFKVRPSSQRWPRGKQISLRARPVDLVLGVETGNPSYPNSYPLDVDTNTYRQFVNFTDDFITNLNANQPDRTTLYAKTQLADMLQDPFDAPTVALANANKPAALAATGGRLPWFPGMRVGVVYPLGGETGVMSINKWVDINHWTICANALSIILAMRNSDDPRVVIDAESYGADALEAGVQSLAAIGKTVADLHAAMVPFTNVLTAANATGNGVVVLTHPNVLQGINEVCVHILNTLGAKRTHLQGEVTFQGDNRLRVAPVVDPNLTSYSQIKANHQQMRSELEAYCGAGPLIIIPVVDNYYWQDCGRLQREKISEISSHGVWAFDDLRGVFADSPYPSTDQRQLYGTVDFRTLYSLHSTNRRNYHWRFPGGFVLTPPMSVGTAATPLAASLWTSTLQSSMAIGGNGLFMDVLGWRLRPQGGNIYATIRVPALPTSSPQDFSIFCKFQVPTGSSGDRPVLSISRTNIGLWQVYLAADGNLYFQGNTGQGAGGVNPVLLKTGLSLGADHKLTVVRAGATTWRFKVDTDTVINHTHSTTLGTDPEIMFGAGEEVATFHTSNKILSTVDFLAIELSSVWSSWTSTEMDAVNGSDDYPIHRST